MEFLILGSLQIRVADRLVEIGAGKQRALLGVLLIHANQVVSIDRLLEEAWGDRQPSGGVKTLRHITSPSSEMPWKPTVIGATRG